MSRTSSAGESWADSLAVAALKMLEAERQRWFLWAPVLVAIGSAAYISLAFEPSGGAVLVAACSAATVVWLARRRRIVIFCIAGACVVAGFSLGKLRTELIGGPIIESRSAIVDVAGWIVSAAPAGNGQRVVVRVERLADWPAAEVPYHVRLNIYGAGRRLRAGETIAVRTRLSPVPGPVRPGGFDFARRAWFDDIGGSGLVFGTVEAAEDLDEVPWDIRLRALADMVRAKIVERVESALPERQGAFITAVTTGQRSSLDDATVESLRHSGLAHLLAISGLHMALVAGTCFALVRALLALVPTLALNYPIKKWAAATAIVLAVVYLVLSGASVSTQRAFIMVTIMFGAVLLDRPAISIRNVAIAALLILVIRPESAVDVSFQMSFITVAALISYYEWRLDVREHNERRAPPTGTWGGLRRRLMFYFSGVVMTTVIAGFATGPVSAYHFNTVATYGVLANVVAVPLMGMVVMPFALFAVLAIPFGLDHFFFYVSGWAVSHILSVAEAVSGLSGSVQVVGAVPLTAALSIVAGIMWLCLWKRKWRLLGSAFIAGGLVLGSFKDHPLVLVDREAKVIAVRNQDGELVLSNSRAGRFVSERWLRADGDGASVRDAAQRAGFTCDDRACVFAAEGDVSVALLTSPEGLWDECRRADVIVAMFPIGAGCSNPQLVIDWWDVYDHGAHAVYAVSGGLELRRANDLRGVRPWVPPEWQPAAVEPEPVTGTSNE
jgi:competence protein ComEC